MAATSAPASAMASISRRAIPFAAPRRPACAAPSTPACGSPARIGTQSAASTPRATPGAAVTIPSQSGSCSVVPPGPPTRTTVLPWTCRIHTIRSAGRPICSATTDLFTRTAEGSSPTDPPRFRLSYGAAETPPRRVVNRVPITGAGTRQVRSTCRSALHERRDVHVVVVQVELLAATADRRPLVLWRLGRVPPGRLLLVGRSGAAGGRRRRRRVLRLRRHLRLGPLRMRGEAAVAVPVETAAGQPVEPAVAPGALARSVQPPAGATDRTLTGGGPDPLVDAGRQHRRARVEPGGDDGDPDFVAERVVDDGAEDDVRVLVRRLLHQRRGLVDVEQAEVGPARDGQQHAVRTVHGRLQQRRVDRLLSRLHRAPLAARGADAHQR